jgi:hypothetical protein
MPLATANCFGLCGELRVLADRIESFPESTLRHLIDQIPPEWYDAARNELERLLTLLLERRSRVRDLLLSFKNPSRNPFPTWREISQAANESLSFVLCDLNRSIS